MAVCLLTNSPEAGRLYYRLFSEIFGHYAGITPAAEPERAPGDRTDGAAGADLARHAGRYSAPRAGTTSSSATAGCA